MTAAGGSERNGTIFQVNLDGTGYSILKDFVYPDGASFSQSGLIFTNNTFYGTTTSDGNGQISGTVFSLEMTPSPLRVNADSNLAFAGGVFSFSVTGPWGATAVVSSSTNLTTWQPVATNTLQNGVFYFNDTVAGDTTSRYYRAEITP